MERILVSRPEPTPEILTSKNFIPLSRQLLTTISQATCAANGVLFFEPLKPQPPDDDQDKTLPERSERETIDLNLFFNF